MGRFGERTHDLLMRGGFQYDSKKDKYFARGEATWDKEKRIEMGKKQYAVPATSVEQFLKDVEKMVDALLERVKAKAAKNGKELLKTEDEAEADEEAPKPKKRKAAEAEQDEDAAPAKKEKKKKKVVEEEEEEE